MKNKRKVRNLVYLSSILLLSVSIAILACSKVDVKTHTISYANLTDEEILKLPKEFTEGKTTVIPAVTRVGNEMLGWYYDAMLADPLPMSNTGSYYLATSNNDVTLYAGFRAQGYGIYYALSGGTLSEGSPTMHTYGRDTVLVEAVREGYTFAGWYDTSNLDIALSVLDGYAYTSSITLIARWTANIYKIECELNGGTLSDNTLTEHIYGTSTSLKNSSKDNYTFVII